MAGDIQQLQARFDYYVNTHPECKVFTYDGILSAMVRDKVITQAQANELKQSHSLYGFGYNLAKQQNNFQIPGLTLESSNPASNKKEGNLLQDFKYHKQYPTLVVDTKGNIDRKQFSESYIKTRFSGKQYDIIKENDGSITILKDKVPYIRYSGFEQTSPTYQIQSFDNRGQLKQNLHLNKGNLRAEFVCNVNGNNSVVTTYDILTGWKIEEITTKNQFDQTKVKYYKGKPYRRFSNTELDVNLVAQNIHNDIVAKNKWGLPTTLPKIKTDILNRIDAGNVFEVLLDYYNDYEETMPTDIKNEWDCELNPQLKARLLKHIDKCVQQADKSDENATMYIACRLYDLTYSESDPQELKKFVKMLDKYNIDEIMKTYLALTQAINQDERSSAGDIADMINGTKKILNFISPTSSLILTAIFGNVDEKRVDNYINQYLYPVQTLSEAIKNQTDMPEAMKTELFNHIVSTVKSTATSQKYLKDIEKDLQAHKNDNHKYGIDLMRYAGRSESIEGNEDCSKANGKFDVKLQQTTTGNCWLIGGLIAMACKPNGLQFLESCLQVDAQGNETVNLKGLNKSYKISADAIANSNHLASNEGDVRGINLAIDKYLQHQSYQSDNNLDIRVDLDGNRFGTLWESFLGNSNSELSVRDFSQDFHEFNDPNKFFGFGIYDENLEHKFFTASEQETLEDIPTSHALPITRVDDEYIYFANPWGAKDKDGDFVEMDITKPYEFKITKELFIKLNPEIETAELPAKYRRK